MAKRLASTRQNLITSASKTRRSGDQSCRTEFPRILPNENGEVLKNKPVNQKYLDEISKRAGKNWRSLLTQLGEDSSTIEGFLLHSSNDTIEACFKGLVHWLEGNADPVTWETLLKALREANMKGYADDLEKELKGPSQDNTSEQMSQLPAPDRSGSDTTEQSNEVKSHTGLTESKAKDSKPTVRPSTPLSKECTDNNETQDSSSPKGPPMKHFYRILESTSCTPQAFEVRYRHIRKDGMTNIKLSRDLWELVQVDPQADPLIKCVYFCLGMTSAPENLDYIWKTWNDLSQQLTAGKSFEIGSLFGSYLIAWTIYNCAEYRCLPSNTENIPLSGLPKIPRSKDGAMKLINYCIEKTDSMSNFPLKPFFRITKCRWEFERRRFEGDLDESVAKTLLKDIVEVVQLCHSFDQNWMKNDSFGAIVSAINLKIEIAIHFKERIRDNSKFESLKKEAEGNLKELTEDFKRNRSDIPKYDEAWLNSVQSKFCRMIGVKSQAHQNPEEAAYLYLECGRPWRALEEAKHTGDSNLIEQCESKCSAELKSETQFDISMLCPLNNPQDQ